MVTASARVFPPLTCGKAVGVTSFERDLDDDQPLRTHFDPRRREIHLVGLGRRTHAGDEQNNAQDAPHRSDPIHEPAPTAFSSSVRRLTSNSATVTMSPSGARRA